MGEIWKRLRERKLVQWAVAYLAAAWLVLQLLDILAQPFGWPDLVLRAATVLLAVGFFAILILAWFHGERGQQRVTGVELLMLAGVLGIAAAGVALVVRKREPQVDAKSASVDTAAALNPRSIAVLPFVDLSPAKDQEYLGDGIAEQLINMLTRLEDLRVTARTSAFAFKGKNLDVREIARQLSVAHVLEGSVAKAGNRVRISAQLIDARNGFHIWSETFDRELSDIFSLQDEIGQAIARGLTIRLDADVRSSMASHGTGNARAYELYLLGLHQWNQRSAESLDRALHYFEQAIALDPAFAAAHAMRAQVYFVKQDFPGKSSVKPDWTSIRASALQALALDSTSAEAHIVLGIVDAFGKHDFASAEERMQRAIRLEPKYPTAHHWYAHLLRAAGRSSEAVREAELARELDPLSLPFNYHLSNVYYNARRFDDAVRQARHTARLAPNSSAPYKTLGDIALSQRQYRDAAQYYRSWAGLGGRDTLLIASAIEATQSALRQGGARTTVRQDAIRKVDALLAASPTGYEQAIAVHLIAALGDTTRALEIVDRGLADGFRFYLYDPLYDPLRSAARFRGLLRKAGVDRPGME